MKSTLLIAIVGIIVYSNSLYNGFHYDDFHSIVNNFHIRDIDNWMSYFLSTDSFSVDKSKSMYRPVLLLTYAINYFFGGYNVLGYHIVNVLIHICNAILLRAVIVGLGYSTSAGLSAALLFLVHPITSEPVNYISSRSDSLAAMFYLSSFWNYINWRKCNQGTYLIGFLSCFLFALLSKSSAISLVILIPVYDYVYNCKFKWRVWWNNVWKQYSIMAAIAGLYIVCLKITGFLNASFKNPARGLLDQFTTQIKALIFYLKLTLFPTGLNVDHQFLLGTTEQSAYWFALILALSIVAVIFFANRYRLKVLFFFPCWALISLLPVTLMPLNILVNERRIYLVTAALCAGVGIVAFSKKYRSKSISLIIISVIVLASQSFQRNEVWLDEFSLWSDSIAKSPLGVRSHLYLGNAYKDLALSFPLHDLQRDEHWDSARKNYDMAIKKSDGTGPLALRALNNLGAVCFSIGDYVGAEEAYRLAVEIDSSFVDALINLGTIYHNRGRSNSNARNKMNNIQTSVDYYNKVVDLSPNNAVAWTSLGLAYADLGLFSDAKKSYDRALFLDPKNSQTWSNIGSYYILKGNQHWDSLRDSTKAYYLEATQYMQKSLELNPHHTPTKLTLESVEKVLSEWKK